MKTKTLLSLMILSFVFLVGCSNDPTTTTTVNSSSTLTTTTSDSTVLTTSLDTTHMITTTSIFTTTTSSLISTNPTTVTTENATTTAEELFYTVYLEVDGGILESVMIENLLSETTVTLPTPTKDGYIFGGWYESVKSSVPLSSVTILSSDITVYANWGTEGLEYTLIEDESAYEVSIGVVSDIPIIEIPKQYQDKPVKRIANHGFKELDFMEEIIIPNTILAIGDRAFQSAYNLTSFNFPESLEHIGNTVFRFCSNLESFNVDENNQNFKAIDGILFSKDETILIRYPQALTSTTYIVPESVIIIREDAFASNFYLVTVEIGSNVTSIYDHAFYNCPYITNFTIPDNVTFVGIYLFRQSGLQEITIGSGLTSISSYMFDGCSSLETIIIPVNITSIGYSAFSYCINLKTIVIMRPNSMGLINGALFMFDNTNSLLKIYFVDQGTLIDYETASYWSTFKSRFEIYNP